MTDPQKYRMRLVRAHMDYITSMINDIDTMLDSLVVPYENAIQLLCTIPGVDRNSAITVISEIGIDMASISSGGVSVKSFADSLVLQVDWMRNITKMDITNL